MTIKKLGTVALTSLMLIGALAGGAAAASDLEGLPNRAYFVVNIYYCAPPATTPVDTRSVPTGAAAILYEEVLMGAYGGNCEEFYANEIRPRLHLSDGES